jgi:hypothetical protein
LNEISSKCVSWSAKKKGNFRYARPAPKLLDFDAAKSPPFDAREQQELISCLLTSADERENQRKKAVVRCRNIVVFYSPLGCSDDFDIFFGPSQHRKFYFNSSNA